MSENKVGCLLCESGSAWYEHQGVIFHVVTDEGKVKFVECEMSPVHPVNGGQLIKAPRFAPEKRNAQPEEA